MIHPRTDSELVCRVCHADAASVDLTDRQYDDMGLEDFLELKAGAFAGGSPGAALPSIPEAAEGEEGAQEGEEDLVPGRSGAWELCRFVLKS